MGLFKRFKRDQQPRFPDLLVRLAGDQLYRSTRTIDAMIETLKQVPTSNVEEEMVKASAISALTEQVKTNKGVLRTVGFDVDAAYRDYPTHTIGKQKSTTDMLDAIETRQKKRDALRGEGLTDDEREQLLDEVYRKGRRGPHETQ
jgi:hypothetical protein